MYYDIHTHHLPQQPEPGIVTVFNQYKNFATAPAGFFTAGLHPWYLQQASLPAEIQQLEKLLQHKALLAVGECGLDKITTIDFALQQNAFSRQIELARTYNKPLVIHCVKAFPETLALLKQVNTPVVFHGINNKLSVIQPVIDAGHYLSFGKSLLQPGAAVTAAFVATPLNRLFLETDDTAADIRDVYKSAAKIRNIAEKEIVLQLEENFNQVFHGGY